VLFRNGLKAPELAREFAVETAGDAAITDRPLLVKSLIVVALTLLGFVVHQPLGLEAATIALLGATALMLIARVDPHDVLREVEWKTLFFFVGLFILVEGVVAVGLVSDMADALASIVGGDATLASVGLLWFSAGASAVIDNIPYTATAIPVVERLIQTGLPADPLWWSLALGACLGGNLTIVGASANVVVVNTAAREGHRIGFLEFMRYGALVTLLSLIISTVYVWLVYLYPR
jgi:Na+/H+ antiporter NhaD/arsenite permease-like protein